MYNIFFSVFTSICFHNFTKWNWKGTNYNLFQTKLLFSLIDMNIV